MKTFIIITSILFLFGIICPGTLRRLTLEENQLPIDLSNSLSHLFYYQFGSYSAIGILFMVCILCVVPELFSKINLRSALLLTVFGHGVTILFDLFVFRNASYTLRIWFLPTTLNTLILIIAFNHAFKRYKIRLKLNMILLICSCVMGGFTIYQVTKLTKYAKMYDAEVRNYQTKNKVDTFEKKPDPGLTSSSFPNFNDSLYINFYRR